MPTASQTADSDLVVQEHCIDLPGETVQCWVGGRTDKLKVILRKHRDVIFDIHLGNGKTYSLETTESDFYNARDKKLVYAARHGTVTFKDGERMHVWVSRGFCGSLILKCDDHILSEVKPNEWDTHRYSDDPKEKPAPIIVSIGHQPTAPKPTLQLSLTGHDRPHVGEQSLHVHEVSPEGAPAYILEFFERGGESLHLDKESIITRNWILAQLFGAEAYMFDNREWLNELLECRFHLLKIFHKSGPRMYMAFKANNRIGQLIYGLQHSKIIKITGGAGGVKQAWDATKGATKDSLKVFAKEEGKMVAKGGGIAVVLTISMDIAEWYKDYSERGADGKPKKDLCDLFAKVGTDLGKAGLVAALTTASTAFLFGAAALAGFTAAVPVIAVVVGTIFIGAVWAFFVEKGDKAIGRSLGEADTTTWAAKQLRETVQYLASVHKDFQYQHYQLEHILPIGR